MEDFVDKNALEPLFTALADKCLSSENGILTMINPTDALCAPSAHEKRRILAKHYHIHTVLTCHQPGQVNLSQNTNINESIVVLSRHSDPKPPTRFINLDGLPKDEGEVVDLHRYLLECQRGQIAEGWGEVSFWPAERIEAGDWTPAIWRSPELAQAAYAYASGEDLQNIEQETIYLSGRRVSEFCNEAEENDLGSFALLHSKGADGQTTITAVPDRYYKPKEAENRKCMQGVVNLKARAAYLLITDGQDSAAARLTAVASDTKYVGVGWMPMAGFSSEESKGIAVYLNSTPGRLQLMRNAGRKLEFPMYRPAAYAGTRFPNIKNTRIRQILADCWERTRNMVVPQFREGECEVRRLWDEAVAEAMNWDANELARLRNLLHNEPHVCGRGHGQYADGADIEPSDRVRFSQLADQWERDTVFLSFTDKIIAHPAHREIVSMGESAIPLILERMNAQGGLWFNALKEITGENPVRQGDRGEVTFIQETWLKWGEANGYI